MASLQVAARPSSIINEKHRQILNVMKQEAKRNLDIQAGHTAITPMIQGAAAAGQATTRALMYNNGVGIVHFQENKNWSGQMLGHYPSLINVNRSGKFSHRGVFPRATRGSMGAIVYVGPNVEGGPTDTCAWVFAWSVVPGSHSENKVYVETGPSCKYPKGQVDWDAIKANLENATNESHDYNDDSNTEISASIDNKGNTPHLSVVFDVTV